MGQGDREPTIDLHVGHPLALLSLEPNFTSCVCLIYIKNQSEGI